MAARSRLDVAARTADTANQQIPRQSVDECATVRASTLSLFDGLPAVALTRVGIANGNPMSVRAAALHIAGHGLHDLKSIQVNYGRKGDA